MFSLIIILLINQIIKSIIIFCKDKFNLCNYYRDNFIDFFEMILNYNVDDIYINKDNNYLKYDYIIDFNNTEAYLSNNILLINDKIDVLRVEYLPNYFLLYLLVFIIISYLLIILLFYLLENENNLKYNKIVNYIKCGIIFFNNLCFKKGYYFNTTISKIIYILSILLTLYFLKLIFIYCIIEVINNKYDMLNKLNIIDNKILSNNYNVLLSRKIIKMFYVNLNIYLVNKNLQSNKINNNILALFINNNIVIQDNNNINSYYIYLFPSLLYIFILLIIILSLLYLITKIKSKHKLISIIDPKKNYILLKNEKKELYFKELLTVLKNILRYINKNI